MGELRHALTVFGRAYVIALILLAGLAFVVARLTSLDLITVFQLTLFFIGIAFVFASILAWTGFGNLYRYSPTLYAGSPSYRRAIVRGEIAREGRSTEALVIGISFGLALLGSGVALSGWAAALGVLTVAIGVVVYLYRREAAVSASG